MLRGFLSVACAFALTGCSTAQMFIDYNKSLVDETGKDRVAMAFDMQSQTRIYPETGECINLYAPKNGFLGGTQDKNLHFPVVEGMSEKPNIVHWVSSRKKIVVRIIYTAYHDEGGLMRSGKKVSESVYAFEPEAGAYYYVKEDKTIYLRYGRENYLHIYKIVDDGKGKKALEEVVNVSTYNCPGQQPWYLKNGAII